MLGDQAGCRHVVVQREVCGETLGLPSLCRLQAMQRDPAQKCPSPRGDHWAGAIVTLNVVQAAPPVSWLSARAHQCMHCEHHLGSYRCARAGGQPINARVLNPDLECVDTPPRWRRVSNERR